MKPTIIVLLSVVTLIVSQKTVPCEKEIKTCFAKQTPRAQKLVKEYLNLVSERCECIPDNQCTLEKFIRCLIAMIKAVFAKAPKVQPRIAGVTSVRAVDPRQELISCIIGGCTSL